jgi:hypothetical protein
MATITSATSSSYENTSRRSYISMMPFNADFFTYTTSVNPTTYMTSGTLTTVSGATAGNCPLGRVLRETGRKLIPGANPDITVYMVEVFDNVTFLRGYINPNSAVYTPFNSDKPAFMEAPYVSDLDVSGGTYNSGGFAGASSYGPPILTRGNILNDGYIEAGGQIRCLPSASLSSTTLVNVGACQTFTMAAPVGITKTLTVDTASYVPTNGDRITIFIFQAAGTATGTVAFGSGFASTSNLATVAAPVGDRYYSITFQCVGTIGSISNAMIEVCRTSAQTYTA